MEAEGDRSIPSPYSLLDDEQWREIVSLPLFPLCLISSFKMAAMHRNWLISLSLAQCRCMFVFSKPPHSALFCVCVCVVHPVRRSGSLVIQSSPVAYENKKKEEREKKRGQSHLIKVTTVFCFQFFLFCFFVVCRRSDLIGTGCVIQPV